MIIIFNIIVIILALTALYAGLCRSLMMFQQNSYRASRFMRWIKESGDSTSPNRLIAMLVVLIVLVPRFPAWLGMVLIGMFCLVSSTTLLRRKYKKPLAYTMRAKRILAAALILSVLIAGASAALFAGGNFDSASLACTDAILACYAASLFIIMAADWLLTPVEKSITQRYIREAEAKLASMPDLKIIGVTGSYGKTTTKHYLQRILSEKYETLMTPGSYNTTLGVVRTVREYLKPYHEVFIVEMGAKQPDDIAEICRLVLPHAGIITAIGPQHLESFKTIENVQATKFELVDSLPADGLALVNNDFEKIADRPVKNVKCLRYAVKNTGNADYIAKDIHYTPHGTEFTMLRTADGYTLALETHLVGECNVSNLLAAAAMAQYMGVPDDRIQYAVSKIEQVEHRLSIKRTAGNLTIIDDAFNSNPVGSAMALDVLASMTQGRRILITPGMIELGDREAELNEAFGFKAATCCDIALVVGQYNRQAIVDGLKRGGMDDSAIHCPDTFAEAQMILQSIARSGDTVLYENDLPDTFK